MNTMVGMQASLHPPMEDSFSDLMKNDSGPVTYDNGDEIHDFEDDDFDPEDLLKSPLFNDSAEKFSNSISEEASFGNFQTDDNIYSDYDSNIIKSNLNDSNLNNSNAFGGRNHSGGGPMRSDNMGMNGFDVLKQQQQQQSIVSSSLKNQFPNTTTINSQGLAPPTVSPVETPQDGAFNSFGGQPQDNFAALAMQQQQQQLLLQLQSCYNADDSSEFDPRPIANDYIMQQQPQRQQQRFPPDRSATSSGSSFQSDEASFQRSAPAASVSVSYLPTQTNPIQASGLPPISRATLPQRSQSYNTAVTGTNASPDGMNQLQVMQQQLHSTPDGMNQLQAMQQQLHATPDGMNQLQAMQQQLQKLQELDRIEKMQRRLSDLSHHSNSLSQSMHSGRTPPPRHASANADLSRSMHYEPTNNHSNGPDVNSLQPPFANNNVSIASEAQNMKGVVDGGDRTPSGNNELMEKLCESMKRSAMSRNLVKQYSGRSLVKQGSARQMLSRQNSGRNMLGRTMSGRNLMKQGSSHSLAMDDNSGRSMTSTGGSIPIRRMSDTKHHLTPPNRGVYRHDSQRSLGGAHSMHGVVLNIDGRNVGTL